MENKRKIILIIYLSISFFSCYQNKSAAIHQLISCEEGRSKCSLEVNNQSIEKVISNLDVQPLEDFIDIPSFNNLIQSKQDSNLVRNSFYFDYLQELYFRDKFYLYRTKKEGDKLMLIALCKSNDYELLGGAYIKIKNEIYWMDKQLDNADINTFKTIDAYQNKAELPITLGVDQYTLFYGENKISKDVFETLILKDKGSIRNQYFKENKRE